MTLSSDDCKKVEMMAELKIRQYFDHFLMNIYPELMKNHIQACPAQKQISRVKWALIGGAIVLMIVIPTFGKPLLAFLKTVV